AAIRNDAEGAAMIAAILNLHIGPRLRAEALDHVQRRLPHRHDVVDVDPLRVARAKIPKRAALGLLLIADDVIDFRHLGEAARIDLRRATCDHDLRIWSRAAGFADRLPRLAHGLRRHRAGIEDHRVLEPCVLGMAPHHLGFIGVEAATEGDDFNLRHDRLLTRNIYSSEAGQVPSKSSAYAPVIRISPSLSRHSIRRSPPGSVTLTLRPVRFSLAAATA